MRDIVGLYLSPPNRALVLSVDEKSQIQALDREQPVLPMMPGMPERRTHSYVRHGTTSLFAALDVASGFVIGKCYKRHRAAEFLDFLKQIDAEFPMASTSTSSWTTTPPTRRRRSRPGWRGGRIIMCISHRHRRPGSIRSSGGLPNSPASNSAAASIPPTSQLEADIRAFIERHNENPKPYRWTKSADEILASVKRFCQKNSPYGRTLDSDD